MFQMNWFRGDDCHWVVWFNFMWSIGTTKIKWLMNYAYFSWNHLVVLSENSLYQFTKWQMLNTLKAYFRLEGINCVMFSVKVVFQSWTIISELILMCWFILNSMLAHASLTLMQCSLCLDQFSFIKIQEFSTFHSPSSNVPNIVST